MKILINVIRVLVGILFIFSGLVKANDPIGLSYKMQEFFAVWGTGFLNGISLWLSIIMIALEIIAGAALLLGWQVKLNSWFLLLLIVFFSFLTGYAFLSGKFRSCGCFGDCIPITSGVSFLKDIILLVLIVLIFFNQRYIKPVFSKSATLLLMLLVSLFSFAAQWYTLHYLPVQDCLPFKKGNNIRQQMQMPANAIPDSTVITFVYEKDGRQVEFTADAFPADFNDSIYHFVNRYDKVIKKGSNNTAPINGYALTDENGVDKGDEILQQEKVLLLFVEDISRPVKTWQKSFEPVYAIALQKNIPVYVVTSMRKSLHSALAKTSFAHIPILDADRVMIRTAARTNPTLYYLENATISGKWSYKNFDNAAKLLSSIQGLVIKPIQKNMQTDSVKN